MLTVFATTLLLVVGVAGVLTPAAEAANADITIAANSSAPIPTGSAATYTINFSCSAVLGSTCGTNPTITIPLDTTTTPSMLSWVYGATSSISGLISTTTPPAVVGNDYVITLNETNLHPGDSDTITLSVTPPNNITPNGTAWSLLPSFAASASSATAPTPASSTATAQARISTSKTTSDGGSIYVRGNNVIYNIRAQCNSGNATGNLYLTDGSLVDTLPANLTFVSATPTPTSAPTVGSSGAITWNYPTAADLPAGCSASGGGTTTYQVVAQIDPTTPNNTSLVNPVVFSGTAIGGGSASTSANRAVTAVAVPPTNPGNFVSKSAKGPLNVPGLGYKATYAGNWITPIQPRPSASSLGSVEGQYTVTIGYGGLSGGFQTDVADPVPCLDSHSGVVYSSQSPSGAVNGSGSIDNLCQHPAFNPTAVQVTSSSLAAAITNNSWKPIGIRPDGTTFLLVQSGSTGSSTYFDVPTGELGNVAAIELPRDSNLTDPTMTMVVSGYGVSSLQGGDVLHDIATATAYPTSGPGSPVTTNQSADLYIQPSAPQLGVLKAFGTLGAAPSGTTALNLTGSVAVPAALTGNVVLTDLLPLGLTWHNPVSTANFGVTRSAGGSSTSVPGTVVSIANFQSTGRTLIRATVPASAFATPGFYTITPPTNLITLDVPTAATTYTNTGQLFVAGIGQSTSPVCGPGTTSTPSTFQSSDPLDLDGDGVVNENSCSWDATLTVPPSGGPGFTLVKSVQGDLDPLPKYSPGIGDASPNGSGTYTLQWGNTGGTTLTTPVVYDILPHIGDTGVSQSQSTVARGSQFTTPFTGVVGTLPTGVTVAYSQSENPCRPEVFPNTANPTCVNDWTSTLPSPASLVKSLRFTGAASYAAGTGFTVGIGVSVPAGYVNSIAWNSAASDASYNGSLLLPAEPPKVGLTAPAPPLTPTLTTSVSAAQTLPGGSVTDNVVVGNTGGAAGTIAWSLVGPVAPNGSGTCTGLTWTGAATVASGTIPVSGDGTYATPASTPTAAGCYGYAAQVTGSAFAGPASSAVGTTGETVLVAPPTVTTTASAAAILTGGTANDTIVVAGTGGNPGSLAWQLVGPVLPNGSGTCTGLDWSTAATLDQGTIAVSGDGTYTTTDSTPIAAGCYAYAVTLTGSAYGGSVLSPAGTAGELVQATAPLVPPVIPPVVPPVTPPVPPATPTVHVTITKTVAKANVLLGSSLTYVLTARNSGPGTATDVTVTDTPQSPMTFVSATPRQGTCGTGFPLVCDVGTIAPGGHVRVVVVARPRAAGEVVNGAHVTTPDTNTAPASGVLDTSTAAVMMPLKLSKTADASTVDAGALLRYRIAVRNPTGAPARRVLVCDRLPAGLTYVTASVRTHLVRGVRCWTVATLPAHATKAFTITVRAQAGARGTIVNTARISGTVVRTSTSAASVNVLPANVPAHFTG